MRCGMMHVHVGGCASVHVQACVCELIVLPSYKVGLSSPLGAFLSRGGCRPSEVVTPTVLALS